MHDEHHLYSVIILPVRIWCLELSVLGLDLGELRLNGVLGLNRLILSVLHLQSRRRVDLDV